MRILVHLSAEECTTSYPTPLPIGVLGTLRLYSVSLPTYVPSIDALHSYSPTRPPVPSLSLFTYTLIACTRSGWELLTWVSDKGAQYVLWVRPSPFFAAKSSNPSGRNEKCKNSVTFNSAKLIHTCYLGCPNKFRIIESFIIAQNFQLNLASLVPLDDKREGEGGCPTSTCPHHSPVPHSCYWLF